MANKNLIVKLNYAGVGQLLKSAEMQRVLEEQARRLAGTDGEVEVYIAGTRAVAEAKQNGLNNNLLKAMKS